MIDVNNALSLIEPLQVIGLLASGFLFGALVLALSAAPTNFVASIVVMAGVTYFVFTIVIRYLSPDIPFAVAERTIGTGLLWIVFSGGAWVGLWARRHG